MKLLLILLLVSSFAWGQKTVMDFDDENFAYQVKQVDEFIERFNNTHQTLIKSYLKDKYNVEVSREELVTSLFDFSKKDWDKQQIDAFLEDVVRQKDPPYISFYDHDWYARVVCEGIYKKQSVHFTLILSVKNDYDKNAVSWIINSMQANFLGVHGNVQTDITLPPNSHGTGFLELKHIFSSPQKYLDSAQAKDNSLNLLLQSIIDGNTEFKQVKNVSYHFMQLDRWIFKIEEFERRERNNGWLISELQAAGLAEKEAYMRTQLFISH